MNQHYTIELRHEGKSKTWKRLSVSTLSPEAIDGPAYRALFAKNKKIDEAQVSFRIIEIPSTQIGLSSGDPIRIVKQVDAGSASP